MSAAVTLLKNEGVTRLGEVVCGTTERNLGVRLWQQPEVVVPVPLHSLRLRERGYNQAELIARPLATRLRLALKTACS